MGKVLLDMAMSLDGFIAGPNGEDGGLHDYFFAPAAPTTQIIDEGINNTGAIIMGRRTYEAGAQQDGFADTPYQAVNIVVTHQIPQSVARGAEAFIFVTDGIESALQCARAAAADKDVVIGGGANIAQQFLQARLVDEIQIHLVPVLFGAGLRLFDQISTEHIALERTRVVESIGVTHLKFRVIR